MIDCSSPAPGDLSEERPVSLPGLGLVVVGFDERPASRDALALAKALVAGSGAKLVVASVRPYWPELIGKAAYERTVRKDEAWLRREATKLLGEVPFSTFVVGGGHETGGLKEIARVEGADLIVIGSTHRGPLGRVLPGSVGERVLDNAPCAVAIAPLGLAESGLDLRRVAVAYDGSRQARIALARGVSLAQNAGAELQILGAVDVEIDTVGLAAVSKEELEEERMRGHLEEARKGVPTSVPVEVRLLHGSPSHVLPEAAAAADLLVVGSRGHYGRTRRLFLGSVAARVARNAPCATLITPAG